jgi:hypothetical protein
LHGASGQNGGQRVPAFVYEGHEEAERVSEKARVGQKPERQRDQRGDEQGARLRARVVCDLHSHHFHLKISAQLPTNLLDKLSRLRLLLILRRSTRKGKSKKATTKPGLPKAQL